MDAGDEHTLGFLLDFDGRVHWLEEGYWLKFEIKRVEASPDRPHGLVYSFTLHRPDGRRIMGFDNAHTARQPGRGSRPVASDHWHRTEDDPGRAYAFTTADQLLADFFAEVRRILAEHGISEQVVAMSDKGDSDDETPEP